MPNNPNFSSAVEGKINVAEPAKPETVAKEVWRLSDELQRRVGVADVQLQFTVDEETGESVIKALDRFQESFLVSAD